MLFPTAAQKADKLHDVCASNSLPTGAKRTRGRAGGLIPEDFVDHEGVTLVGAGVNVVSVVVNHDTELVLALLDVPVVGLLAETGDGARPVVVEPPVTLVLRVSPVLELAWIVAVRAAVAVGVAGHDVPPGP